MSIWSAFLAEAYDVFPTQIWYLRWVCVPQFGGQRCLVWVPRLCLLHMAPPWNGKTEPFAPGIASANVDQLPKCPGMPLQPRCETRKKPEIEIAVFESQDSGLLSAIWLQGGRSLLCHVATTAGVTGLTGTRPESMANKQTMGITTLVWEMEWSRSRKPLLQRQVQTHLSTPFIQRARKLIVSVYIISIHFLMFPPEFTACMCNPPWPSIAYHVADQVMWDFWTARPPLNALISALPLLRPRRYSIASSPGYFSYKIFTSDGVWVDQFGWSGATYHHQTQNLHLSSFLRWAGCGRSTAAWSLLSRPFWWKVVTAPGAGGQLIVLMQASVFHVVLALSNGWAHAAQSRSRSCLPAAWHESWPTFGQNVHRKVCPRIWILGNARHE